MAGLWSRKFDYTNGDTRICKVCNATFHTMKPRYRCNVCVNEAQKIVEAKKRAKYKRKAQYPFDNKTPEAANRFNRIQKELRNAWKEYYKTGDRTIIHAHYDKQLQEIKDNGIMEWILDRRTPEARKEKNPMSMAKSKNMIRKDYPDTRGHYED